MNFIWNMSTKFWLDCCTMYWIWQIGIPLYESLYRRHHQKVDVDLGVGIVIVTNINCTTSARLVNVLDVPELISPTETLIENPQFVYLNYKLFPLIRCINGYVYSVHVHTVLMTANCCLSPLSIYLKLTHLCPHTLVHSICFFLQIDASHTLN